MKLKHTKMGRVNGIFLSIFILISIFIFIHVFILLELSPLSSFLKLQVHVQQRF